MKIKNLLLVLVAMPGGTLKPAAAAPQPPDAVVVNVEDSASVVLNPNVDLSEPTVTGPEVDTVVRAEIRARQNAMAPFDRGEDGLFWRTAHKVRSGVSLVGHVFKYPAVAACGVVAPLYWYVKDEFCAPVKSFIRENFTFVAGVIAAGGFGLGLYYGPKDHAVTEGHKHLKDEVADNKEVIKSLAEKYIIQRKKKEKLEHLNGVIAEAGAALQRLAQQAADTASALTAAKNELESVKDQTARIVRGQQEQRVAAFVRFITDAIKTEADHFERLKAIQENPSTTQDISRLQVALTVVNVQSLCHETLARMHAQTVQGGLPNDLRVLVEGLMQGIRQYDDGLTGIRLKVSNLRKSLESQHQAALADDARKMAALVAAAERSALPAPTSATSAPQMMLANVFGSRTPASFRLFSGISGRGQLTRQWGQSGASDTPVPGLRPSSSTIAEGAPADFETAGNGEGLD